MDKHLEPYIEGLRVVGLELGGDAALHRREVVGPEGLLIVEGEALPEVFTDEIVSLEDGEGSTVGKGAVPVAVDADDRIGRGVEDLAELADGVVAKVFGMFASGDVAVVEGDAVVGRKDVNVKPGVHAFGEVLASLRDAGVHGLVEEAFEFGAKGVGEELPVSLAVDIDGLDAANSDGFGVGVGDDPLSVEAKDGFGNLRDETREGIILCIGLTPETSAAIDRDSRGIGLSIEHEFATKESNATSYRVI